jgi:DNA-binding transcriptional MerR regulator
MNNAPPPLSNAPLPPEAARTLDELCALTQTPKRTVRYYIQLGLLDRPVGETRAARYGEAHLRRLLQIKQLSAAGFSLDRIRERLDGAALGADVYARPPGTVEQWTTLVITEGLELSLDPNRTDLSPGQVRALFRDVLALYEEVKQAGPPAHRSADAV